MKPEFAKDEFELPQIPNPEQFKLDVERLRSFVNPFLGGTDIEPYPWQY